MAHDLDLLPQELFLYYLNKEIAYNLKTADHIHLFRLAEFYMNLSMNHELA